MSKILFGVIAVTAVLMGPVTAGARTGPVTAGPTAAACSSAPIGFGPRVALLDQGTAAPGYEAGIEVDSAGTVFVTAHKLTPVQSRPGRVGSWLWRSDDGGRTFTNLPVPASAHVNPYASEGDLAVDGKDRLYFADTYWGDNQFFRYSDHGKKLDMYRPALGSAWLDDRPWLAAHGDGYVYYLGTTLYTPEGRLSVHRSTDAGATFDPVGFTFPRSGVGFIDADPNSSHVYVVADDLIYSGGGLGHDTTSITTWSSPDRGVTWRPSKIHSGHNLHFPGVAVSPKDGTVYTYWNTGSALKIAQSKDHGATWRTFDVTPFEGSFRNQWAAVGPRGDVAMIFHGQAKGSEQPHLYALSWREQGSCGRRTAGCSGPALSFGRIHDEPGFQQEHFFQVDVSPDNAMNIAFELTRSHDLYFVKQTSGPNLGGQACGRSGRP